MNRELKKELKSAAKTGAMTGTAAGIILPLAFISQFSLSGLLAAFSDSIMLQFTASWMVFGAAIGGIGVGIASLIGASVLHQTKKLLPSNKKSGAIASEDTNIPKRKGPVETVMKATNAIGALAGSFIGPAIIPIGGYKLGMLAAGFLGAIAGSIVLPIAAVATFYLGRTLVRKIGLFPDKKNLSPAISPPAIEKEPSLKGASVQNGFNAKAEPIPDTPRTKAIPPAHEPGR